MNNVNKLLLGGNVLSIIGCFLPFVSVFGYDYPYIKGDGIIVLVLCIVSMVLAFLNKAKISCVANVLALIVTFMGISKLAEISLEFLGVGAYLIIIANIVAIVGSVKSGNN